MPCKYGPFSFKLNGELERFHQAGYIKTDADGLLLGPTRDSENRRRKGLTPPMISVVAHTAKRFGQMASGHPIDSVYRHYA